MSGPVRIGVGTFDRSTAVVLHKAAKAAGWPVETVTDAYSRKWDVRPDADGRGGVECPRFGDPIWIVTAEIPLEAIGGWLSLGPVGLASCWPRTRGGGVSDDGKAWWAT